MNDRRLWVLFLLMSAAVCLLAVASIYGSVVAASNHTAGCHRVDKLATAMEKVVVLATTPPKGAKVSVDQALRLQTFRNQSNVLLDEARC